MSRWVVRLVVAVALLSAAACASARYARGGPGEDQLTAADIERFQPDLLLVEQQQLHLTESQFVALQAVLRDRVSERQTPDEAAAASFRILTVDQRAAVRSVAPRHGHH